MGFRSTWLTALLVCATAPGCSLLVEQGGDQCETNEECTAFPGTTCIEGVCSAGECALNQECIDKYGPYHICRKVDGVCAPLLTNECQKVVGDYTDDNAFLFGASVGHDATGVAEQNAVALAISDFDTATNGLPARPGSSGRRPMVVVACDDDSDQDTAVVAATHLANVVRVPAIVGGSYSGITLRIANDVTIDAGTLVISPSATSTVITELDDNGLVWRTSPSDIYQSVALAQYIKSRLEPEIRAELMLMTSDAIRLSVFHKGDAYGTGLAVALEGDPAFVEINGESVSDPANAGRYKRVDYGDPDNATQNPPHYQDAIDAAIDDQPHIIAIFGTTESIDDVLLPIEAGWNDAVGYKPRYLLADGAYSTPELFAAVKGNEDLRRRISGSVPGTTSSLFSAFKNAYDSKFPGADAKADTFGAPGAYDAAYLLAFAAVANAAQPETGANLALALRRMVGGDDVNVGLNTINTAFQKLSLAGGKIDFDGASGPLNFDVDTGEAPSDVQIWCVTTDSQGGQIGAFTDIYLEAASLTLKGPVTFGSQCNF